MLDIYKKFNSLQSAAHHNSYYLLDHYRRMADNVNNFEDKPAYQLAVAYSQFQKIEAIGFLDLNRLDNIDTFSKSFIDYTNPAKTEKPFLIPVEFNDAFEKFKTQLNELKTSIKNYNDSKKDVELDLRRFFRKEVKYLKDKYTLETILKVCNEVSSELKEQSTDPNYSIKPQHIFDIYEDLVYGINLYGTSDEDKIKELTEFLKLCRHPKIVSEFKSVFFMEKLFSMETLENKSGFFSNNNISKNPGSSVIGHTQTNFATDESRFFSNNNISKNPGSSVKGHTQTNLAPHELVCVRVM